MDRYCPSCDRSFDADVTQCPDDGTSLITLGAGGDPLIGRRVAGRYTLKARLGAGGMGVVYRAWQHSVGRDIAVKLIHPRTGHEEQSAKRFLREVKLASRLSQPSTVAVHDFGQTEDGLLYFAMELIQGRTLGDVLAKDGPFSVDRVVRVGTQICDALEAAHRLSIVHRDLKPTNVMVLDHPPGRDLVKVLDFGLAKTFGEDSGESSVTRSGMVVGTPSYMSPEAARGDATDARSDLYSLGVMLAELASGRLPFAAQTPMQMMQSHLDAEPSLAGDVPTALASVIRKALEKDPAARHASAALMREALEAAREASRGRPVIAARVVDRAAPVSGMTDTAAAPVAPSPAPFEQPSSVVAPPAPSAAMTESALSVARAPASDAAEAGALQRFFAAAALLVGSSALGLWRLGYPGMSFGPRAWVHFGGPPAYAVLAAGVLGLAVILASARWPRLRRLSWWLAAAPGVLGIVGMLIGSSLVLSGLAELPPLGHFVMLNTGMWEANVDRLLGCAVSTVLALVLCAVPGPKAAPARRAWLGAGAIGFALVGAAALALGVRAIGPLVFAALALSIVWWASPAAEARPGARASALLALVMAQACAFASFVALDTAIWSRSPSRGARALALILATRERAFAWWLYAVALALCVGLAWALERERGRGRGRGRAWRRGWVPVALVALVACGDLAAHVRFALLSSRLLAALGGQFSTFAHLDPPSTEALDPRFAPGRAPALQVAREVVALNGVGVARLSALGGADAAVNLGRDLGRALADQAADPERRDADPDLAIAIDREVRWSELRPVLAIVAGAGARRVELLLSRGRASALPADAPREASYVLPDDFVALPIRLEAGGFDPPGDARFDDVAPELIRRAMVDRGSVAVAVAGVAAASEHPRGEHPLDAYEHTLAAAERALDGAHGSEDPAQLEIAAAAACRLGEIDLAGRYAVPLGDAARARVVADCPSLDERALAIGRLRLSLHDRFARAVGRCFARARGEHHARVTLLIAADGRVTDLSAGEATPATAACVADALAAARGDRVDPAPPGRLKLAFSIDVGRSW